METNKNTLLNHLAVARQRFDDTRQKCIALDTAYRSTIQKTLKSHISDQKITELKAIETALSDCILALREDWDCYLADYKKQLENVRSRCLYGDQEARHDAQQELDKIDTQTFDSVYNFADCTAYDGSLYKDAWEEITRTFANGVPTNRDHAIILKNNIILQHGIFALPWVNQMIDHIMHTPTQDPRKALLIQIKEHNEILAKNPYERTTDKPR